MNMTAQQMANIPQARDKIDIMEDRHPQHRKKLN